MLYKLINNKQQQQKQDKTYNKHVILSRDIYSTGCESHINSGPLEQS